MDQLVANLKDFYSKDEGNLSVRRYRETQERAINILEIDKRKETRSIETVTHNTVNKLQVSDVDIIVSRTFGCKTIFRVC